MGKVAAFTSICKEDERWIPQYLAEAERLCIPFFIHFDRCHFSKLARHMFCAGYTSQMDLTKEFDETHKQLIFEKLQRCEYQWAMPWDIDETYERGFRQKLDSVHPSCILNDEVDCIDIRWLNLWEYTDQVRIDGPLMGGHRIKLYNLQGGRGWTFDHPITNGAKLVGEEPVIQKRHDAVCLHWGMMTKELREQHLERWNRIYTKAVGANPYGFWKYCLDPNFPPVTIKHGY